MFNYKLLFSFLVPVHDFAAVDAAAGLVAAFPVTFPFFYLFLSSFREVVFLSEKFLGLK